jgi:reverse gyrase
LRVITHALAPYGVSIDATNASALARSAILRGNRVKHSAAAATTTRSAPGDIHTASHAAKANMTTTSRSVRLMVVVRQNESKSTASQNPLHPLAGPENTTANNPGTIYFELASYQRDDTKVYSVIFSALERRNDWKGNSSRAEFIHQQLRGSHRVIICDEAHLLDASGRQALFNLNRDTGCAVALVGNKEILDKIRRNEQHFSRVGVKGEPALTNKELPYWL